LGVRYLRSAWAFRDFPIYFRTEERPIALLSENSGGKSWAKKPFHRPTRALRNSPVGNGEEERVEVLTLSALRPSPEVLSVMQKNEDMPEKAARRGS